VFVQEHIQHISILIDSPPEIMAFAIDDDKLFVEVPRITRTPLSTPNLVNKRLTELETPLPYSFVGDNNATCSE